MLFNSLEFIIFLPIVFLLYWFVFEKDFRIQNLLLLVSSYIFYGWWDWRFLSLIFLSTLVDYFVGFKIYNSRETKVKKIYLCLSILFNLSLLGFFKYFNFFIDSWISLISILGYENQITWTLKVVLPIGISFYTFQTMSYSLDIYYKKIKPTKDFITFASFISFFPQLIAGPIERASNLLPQLLIERKFKYQQGIEGLQLIIWGMFKKVIVADSLAWRVGYCFDNYQILDGGVLLLGLIYFSFQIYCDFSGYSDIAIGTAKLFGIELMSNFNFPYFSRNIAEFWRRWHISLSSWFKDYLYIPMGGSKNGKWLTVRNVLIIFIISGFWHGANWTFIVWGLSHALLYLPLLLLAKNRSYRNDIVAINSNFPSAKEFFNIIFTYLLTTLSWAFFRGDSISESFQYLILLFTKFSIPSENKGGIILVFVFVMLDWTIRRNERKPLIFDLQIHKLNKKATYLINTVFLFFSIFLITAFALYHTYYSIDAKNFIYFQF